MIIANPGSDHRQIFDHRRPYERVLFDGNKVNGAATFAQRVIFPAQRSVNQTQHAPCWAEVWLSLNDLLLLSAGSSKSDARSFIVFRHTCDKPFNKRTTSWYVGKRR